ncbi:hypothetical protein EGW08_003134 [Elysia chlorotica]|uniref:Apple domain-containing protein n=1 Tax=Elysia chlorotica TaxID=188477 RepID=A0A3S1BQK9_ELYCH|nr:hypothetical protein EGW08_003134 [Elysia chlorotica]
MANTALFSLSSVVEFKPDVSGNIQCAVHCSGAHACYAYQYNTASRLCSLGGDVLPTGAALDASTRLFVRGFDELLLCSSKSFGLVECAPSSPAVTVTLSQQISGSPCTLGTSFGLTASGAVWVDRGCRGQFAVRF